MPFCYHCNGLFCCAGHTVYEGLMFLLRPYQEAVFWNDSTGILILHWSRQIGKTTTLAAWAARRILSRRGHTVTVLSNSLRNGAEFISRARVFCDAFRMNKKRNSLYLSRYEIRISTGATFSRIHALAANPRTARGFSGDLILDEFAFYEDIPGVWDAVEPILALRRNFLCRIASTGNGRRDLFFRMCQNPRFQVSRVSRSDAWRMGVPIWDSRTRQEITPEQARANAVDKDSYDQNYECLFVGDAASLLNGELIHRAAEGETGVICAGDWSEQVWSLLENCATKGGAFFAGVDVGRRHDRTVIVVVQSADGIWYVRALLRLESMRLPEQQSRLVRLLRLPRVECVAIDMTGLGLGLYEYTQQQFGAKRVRGVNFASTVPATSWVAVSRGVGLPKLNSGRPTVRVTESLAMNLVRVYEEGKIRHPLDSILFDDLQLPRRVVTSSGQVSISAERDENGNIGHADHFWALALALDAARQGARKCGSSEVIRPTRRIIL